MSNLEDFVTQVRSILDRGLTVHPDDILDGLQHAMGEQRPGQAVNFRLGVEHIEARIRRRIEAKRTKQQQAESAQQLNIDYTYRGPWPTPGAPKDNDKP